MLKLKANILHKPDNLSGTPECQIEKIVELPKDEFMHLTAYPLVSRGFIAENRELMYERGGIFHCLLALDRDGDDGILIEAEGYDYVRNGAYISHARDFVMRRMNQDVAQYTLDETVPGFAMSQGGL